MLLKPYKGDGNYIFISYSHKNMNEVLGFIETLQNNGYNVWYDEGIDPGTEWDDNIAKHIENCSFFIAFITTEYVESQNCRDEMSFARDLNKERLLVYAEDVELPRGMQMRLNRLQAIYKHKYDNQKDFYNKVFEANLIDTCKNDNVEIEAEDEAVLISTEQVPKGKVLSNKIILIGIAVILALCIGIFAVVNSNNSGKDEVKTDTMQENSDSQDNLDSGGTVGNEDLREVNIVLEDNKKISVTIISYEDSSGVFAIKIKNKTNKVISSYQEGDSVLLDGNKQCIAETDGSSSFAYIDVPAKGETTAFSSFRKNDDDGWDTILKLSDGHTFEFTMSAFDEDFNDVAKYNVKLTPDMFGY